MTVQERKFIVTLSKSISCHSDSTFSAQGFYSPSQRKGNFPSQRKEQFSSEQQKVLYSWLNIYLFFSTSTQKMVKLNLAFNPLHTTRSWISKVTLESKCWSQQEMLLTDFRRALQNTNINSWRICLGIPQAICSSVIISFKLKNLTFSP